MNTYPLLNHLASPVCYDIINYIPMAMAGLRHPPDLSVNCLEKYNAAEIVMRM
jgi:hypothetical protein